MSPSVCLASKFLYLIKKIYERKQNPHSRPLKSFKFRFYFITNDTPNVDTFLIEISVIYSRLRPGQTGIRHTDRLTTPTNSVHIKIL